MITEKKSSLGTILDSANGVHLTSYIANRADLSDLMGQISQCIDEAYRTLRHVLPDQKRRKFMEPLESLRSDASVLERIRGNIAIFRSEQIFRIVSVPVPVEVRTFIATTFHVKPLLRWMQGDPEFLLLGIRPQSAGLYLGTQHTLQLVGTYAFNEALSPLPLREARARRREQRRAAARMNDELRGLSDWVSHLTIQATPNLYVAGADWLAHGVFRNLRYRRVVRTAVRGSFAEGELAQIVASIRARLRVEARKRLEEAIQEVRLSSESKSVGRDLHQIGKAVVQGKVRKLIIADRLNVFGKLDRRTGELAIHPSDMDHEDDDLLDDLAQEVLARGGEVIVADRDELPPGRPAVAILDAGKMTGRAS